MSHSSSESLSPKLWTPRRNGKRRKPSGEDQSASEHDLERDVVRGSRLRRQQPAQRDPAERVDEPAEPLRELERIDQPRAPRLEIGVAERGVPVIGGPEPVPLLEEAIGH